MAVWVAITRPTIRSRDGHGLLRQTPGAHLGQNGYGLRCDDDDDHGDDHGDGRGDGDGDCDDDDDVDDDV